MTVDWEGPFAARNVAGDGRYGCGAVAGMEAGADFCAPCTFRFLQFVELADIGGGEGDGFLDVWFQLCMGAVKVFGGCGNFIGCNGGQVKL